MTYHYYSKWVETESTWYCCLLYQPQMINDGDCGATSGIKFDRGN
jgi:hypothetical protein